MIQEAYSVGDTVVYWSRPTGSIEDIKANMEAYMGDIGVIKYETVELAEAVAEAANRKIVRLP